MADDDDDPQLRSLRAAWRSLPDEDPPERGLSELMAAARQQAEVMAEARTPWWKRALVAMMRPPMLALASVVVLLGGVFVVTSSHKGVSPEPTPMEDQAAPAAAPTVTPPNPVPVGQAGPAGGSSAEPITESAPTPVPPRAPTVAKPSSPTKTVHHAAVRDTDHDSNLKNPFANDSSESTVQKAAPPPPPPRPSAPAATKPAPAAADPDETSGAEDDKPAATRGAVAKVPVVDTTNTPRHQLDDQLLTQCRAAATRGDCELAKKIAQRIATDDAAYYRVNVVTDATIAACLGK
jgi:hypothetical protein